MKNATALLLIGLLGTGCITFNGEEIRRPEVAAPNSTAVVVELEVKKFDKLMNGSAVGVGANFNEGFQGRNEAAQIARIWKSKRLIANFGFPGDLGDGEATHRLVLSGTLDESASLFGAFLTGLTLYLIPSSATMTTDIDVKLIRLSDGKEFESHARNSYTLWQQLFFLPTSLFGSVAWGNLSATIDRSMFLYSSFDALGAFAGIDDRKPE